MKIIKVKTKKDMQSFINLPKKLYHNIPYYIPPIWLDEKKAYNEKNNPILRHSNYILFLLLDDNNAPIGRTIAYIDFSHNKYYKVKMGFFGAFECIDNKKAGALLLDAVEKWLKKKGMKSIRGPINPIAENWGFVYEGYNSPPVYMSPWNPPYYHSFFTNYNYKKAKDLLVYNADMKSGYVLPKRFNSFYDKFIQRYPNISIRRLDMKHLKKDAKSIWKISNVALANNWGYVPLDLSVMEDMFRKLRIIVDPDAVWIVEDNNEPVGFCLGFPDINILLKQIKGHILPFGWIKLLFGIKKLTDYRLFGLAVHPKWHGKALDAIMYIHLYKHLLPKKIRMEANYILEDNLYIKNALEKLGMTHTKTYRIYEKSL